MVEVQEIIQCEKPKITHSGISCEGCQTAEIRGNRFLCEKCNVNFCQVCAFKETTHDPEHVLKMFKRLQKGKDSIKMSPVIIEKVENKVEP